MFGVDDNNDNWAVGDAFSPAMLGAVNAGDGAVELSQFVAGEGLVMASRLGGPSIAISVGGSCGSAIFAGACQKACTGLAKRQHPTTCSKEVW